MLSRFFETVKVQNAKRWFDDIDLTNADISQIEHSINEALVKSKGTSTWDPEPIAPFAEPISLNELLGDHFSGAYNELSGQADRTTNLYTALSQTNNVWKAELEGVEKAFTEASDALQEITFAITDDPKKYFWLSDTFNSTTFVDTKSTALVDTDFGYASLPPAAYKNIPFTVDVATEQAINDKVLPGCPLAILGITYGTVNTAKGKKQMKQDYLDASKAESGREPQVTLESADTINLASLYDSDASSWFEVEKNWIPKTQPIVNQGVSWVYNAGGTSTNILSQNITNNLDWEIYTQWPSSTEGTKVALATFDEDVQTGASLEKKVELTLNVTLNSAAPVSMLDIVPLLRLNISKEAPEINVESISVNTEGNEIEIAKGTKLGSNVSATKIESEVLRRTGYQSTGSLFFIPTDRSIDSIKIKLSSNAVEADKGLAHPWKATKYKYKFKSSVLGFTVSSHTDTYWQRTSIWGTPPVMQAKNEVKQKLTGTLAPLVGTLSLIGTTLEGISSAIASQRTTTAGTAGKSSGSSLTGLTNLVSAAGGKAMGALGGGILKAAGWIGLVAAIPEVASFIYNESRSTEVLDEKTGYDVFKGQRAGIAIRDLSVLQATYSQSAEFISTKRFFPGKVTKIGLFTEEEIPSSWPQGEWVSYYISTDGANWQPIQKLTETNIDRAIQLDTPTDSVYFKIVLKGNTDDIYHSPIVKHYSLQGVPK